MVNSKNRKLSQSEGYGIRKEFNMRLAAYAARAPEEAQKFLSLFGAWYLKLPQNSRAQRLSERISQEAENKGMAYYTFLRLITTEGNPSGKILFARLMGKIDDYNFQRTKCEIQEVDFARLEKKVA